MAETEKMSRVKYDTGERKDFTDSDALIEECDRLEASHEPFLVLLWGQEDSNGKSWCPDCV